VVVTGIGCVTPLGHRRDATWSAAIAGKSGVRRISRFDAASSVADRGRDPGELDLSHVPAKEARRLDRTIALALVAAREALEGSKLTIDAGTASGSASRSGPGSAASRRSSRASTVLAKSGRAACRRS
jgi:3-oxoacyl-[acyl-carrier-protein] synthase II